MPQKNVGTNKNLVSKSLIGKHPLCATIIFLICSLIVGSDGAKMLCGKFQTSSKPPSDLVGVLVVFVVLVVTGVKQSQLQG